ncbi:tetratricopeptide repeat protein [Candidatus Pelagibacter sp.]|nr:tetratricopeptide repeat protein [Candidatus Pelagibacter sp.]
MQKILFILLLIFFNSELNASDRDIQLNYLFNQLKTDNLSSSFETEQKIWEIWSTHPTDEKLTTILNEGSKFVVDRQLSKALDTFSEVIQLDPTWAEAWNKRATVLYLIGDFEGSQRDINKVLELEERHFGALAGQGLVNIKLKNYEKAIKSYEQALEIHPSMKSPEIMIKQIEGLIKEELI